MVQRGFMTIHTNGDIVVKSVVYPKARPAEALDAAAVVAARANQERRELEATAIALPTAVSGRNTSHADRFTALSRRQSGNVSSYHMLIEHCMRSIMDLTAMLTHYIARGALFYMLKYSTKIEQTLDVLLNLLAPVVERIRARSIDTSAADTAVRLVLSCLCKSVWSQPGHGSTRCCRQSPWSRRPQGIARHHELSYGASTRMDGIRRGCKFKAMTIAQPRR